MAEVKRLQFAEGVVITAPADLQAGWTYDDTTGWDGVVTEVTYDLAALAATNPGVPADARKAQWSIWKLSGTDYVKQDAEFTAESATSLVVNAILDDGTYRIMGVY